MSESRGASLLFRQIKINVRTYLPIQSVRGKTCTSLTKITYQMVWCNVFDEISHIPSHSVFIFWISSPSYLTSMFLLLQTSIWLVNRSLIDRRQRSDLQETCTGVCMLLWSQSQCSSFSTCCWLIFLFCPLSFYSSSFDLDYDFQRDYYDR